MDETVSPEVAAFNAYIKELGPTVYAETIRHQFDLMVQAGEYLILAQGKLTAEARLIYERGRDASAWLYAVFSEIRMEQVAVFFERFYTHFCRALIPFVSIG